jgi:hypothetical protein
MKYVIVYISIIVIAIRKKFKIPQVNNEMIKLHMISQTQQTGKAMKFANLCRKCVEIPSTYEFIGFPGLHFL